MVPWLDYDEIIDRQLVYDLARFKNEVLGLPTIIGELGGIEQYSWTVTAYLLTATASTPLYGKLSFMNQSIVTVSTYIAAGGGARSQANESEGCP